jgi:hypothetical protein
LARMDLSSRRTGCGVGAKWDTIDNGRQETERGGARTWQKTEGGDAHKAGGRERRGAHTRQEEREGAHTRQEAETEEGHTLHHGHYCRLSHCPTNLSHCPTNLLQ